VHTEERPYNDKARGQPSAGPGETPHEKLDLLTPLPWTSRPQNYEKINFFCLFKPNKYGSPENCLYVKL
jgi:hypothetical protein